MADAIFVAEARGLPVSPECICVEDYFVTVAEPRLAASGVQKRGGWHFIDVLRLPHGQLIEVCAEAFDKAMEAAAASATKAPEGTEYILVSFHPVLYHQVTTEFIAPYAGHRIASAAEASGFELDRIVSVHDDVFDMYRRLLGPEKLFDPQINREPSLEGDVRVKLREPERDLSEQLMLLSWRDRELASARSLAAAAAAKHFLFHRKGRLDSLTRILFGGEPCVYFSHPISQPRRDVLLLPDGDKCRVPDPQRGYSLIQSTQAFADRLAQFVPVVEPTAIDEYRFSYDRKALSAAEIQTHILPSVTERWPLGGGDRAGGGEADVVTKTEGDLLRAPPGVFDELRCDRVELAPLRGGLRMLQAEIRRQINVRDHILAQQADYVVAYRPYSLPDSPEPTGGVRKEIDAIEQRARLGEPQQKHGVYIFHPPEDERRRRANEFNAAWAKKASEWFERPDSDDVTALKVACRTAMVTHDERADPNREELQGTLRRAIEVSSAALVVPSDSSSMASESLGRHEDAKDRLVDALVESTSILKAYIEVEASGKGSSIQIVRESDLTLERAQDLQKHILGTATQPVELSNGGEQHRSAVERRIDGGAEAGGDVSSARV